ncbi:hypothetical protein BpHYR1_031446 [Brachionus plicatilis]|uniref:Uncharacterized protein n=1 Tax=Brachionus plicatilis TaxID=10195 RepID=A0A3M7PX06_BRAPC|nr:hypothetical protein BpHYR1_031446 [Brachionus plicatilis]
MSDNQNDQCCMVFFDQKTIYEFILIALKRIYMLPLDVPNDEIEDFFNSHQSNVDNEIKNEKLKSFENINNGIVKIKVKYNIRLNSAVLNFAGLHKISNCQALVRKCGMPPKFLGCRKFGHIHKECSKVFFIHQLWSHSLIM